MSIKLHRDISWGVLIQFNIGRVIPGHHMSAPKEATGTTHISTTVNITLGATLHLTELNRRRCCAAFDVLLHQTFTWCLNDSFRSKCNPSYLMCLEGFMLLPFTWISIPFSRRYTGKLMPSDLPVSNETAFFRAH